MSIFCIYIYVNHTELSISSRRSRSFLSEYESRTVVHCSTAGSGAHPHPSNFVHTKSISWEGYTNALALYCCKEGWLLKDRDIDSGSWPRLDGTDRHGTSLMLRMPLCPLHGHRLPKVKRAEMLLPAPSRAAPAGGSN